MNNKMYSCCGDKMLNISYLHKYLMSDIVMSKLIVHKLTFVQTNNIKHMSST